MAGPAGPPAAVRCGGPGSGCAPPHRLSAPRDVRAGSVIAIGRPGQGLRRRALSRRVAAWPGGRGSRRSHALRWQLTETAGVIPPKSDTDLRSTMPSDVGSGNSFDQREELRLLRDRVEDFMLGPSPEHPPAQRTPTGPAAFCRTQGPLSLRAPARVRRVRRPGRPRPGTVRESAAAVQQPPPG